MNICYTPNKDYKKDMGSRLRTYRLRAKLTQENMAEILDVSNKHYSEVERGITGLSVSKLIFLSNFFGISLDHLLKGESNEETLPFVLVNLYKSCPEEKKGSLLNLLRSLSCLTNDSNSPDRPIQKPNAQQ